MIDYLVLAPLTIESRALVVQLENIGAAVMHDVENVEDSVEFEDGRGNLIQAVIKTLTQAGRVSAAIATQEAITRLEPRTVLVVGIAGGLEGRTSLGDILVADQLVDASQRRVSVDGERVQSQVYRASPRLLSAARNLAPSWFERASLRPPTGDAIVPRVHIGPIVSTDTLVTTADYVAPLQDSFRGLLGVEMEGGGVAAAIEAHRSAIDFLVIRCVVDHMNASKSDDWRAYGAQTAATFAITLMRAAHKPSPKVPDKAASVHKRPPATPQQTANSSDSDGKLGEAGSGTDMMRDGGTESPCLNADEYAGALTDVLANASGEICFALLGHWGRGKTYLAKLVENKLRAKYDCVWFSAWKYRSRPELWAHLYESFFRSLKQTAWWRRVPRVFRANLDKHGIGRLLLMFIGAGFAAMPIGLLLLVSVAVLGIFGALRGAMLYFKQRTPVATTLNRFFYVSRHTERLGLQAAIGDDLKSLVVGWVGRLNWSMAQCGFAVAGYVLSVSAFMAGLWLGFQGKPLFGIDRSKWYPSMETLEATLAIIGALAAGLMLWLILAGRNKRRLLLVVDDLDRMPADEMLEVIESLKLFLEHDAIRDLVQIVMICEEESLRNTLAEKYGRPQSPSNARVVEENLQKLFIAHLRLPTLSAKEQHEVLTYFIGAKTNTPAMPVHAEVTVDDKDHSRPPIPTARPEPAPDVPSVTTKSIASSSLPQYTNDERDALHHGLTILSGEHSSWAALGPRAIQSYVLRYKLARRLLVARNATIHPSRLAVSLAARMHEGTDGPARTATPATTIDEVIAEVA